MKIYKTKDLAEASALVVSGERLSKIEKHDGICWFIFNNKENCTHISNQFYFGDLSVNARQYSETLRTLKSRIFSI